MPEHISIRWRPKMWQVVALVLGLVLCLPFAGLLLFQFFASQLVQQTEENLIGQASALSAVYAELFAQNLPADMAVYPLAPARILGRLDGYDPVFPTLSLGQDTVLPPRPEAILVPKTLPRFAPALSRIAMATQQRTLAGFRILDSDGTVIAGTAEIGLSLAAIPEVAAALSGQPSVVMRQRIRSAGTPLIYGLSEGTRLRVFVAMPVEVQGRVVGAVYLNRTPNHIFRFLYGERFTLLKALVFVMGATGLIGLVFWRFVTRPLRTLIAHTQHIEQNDGAKWAPPSHYGTQEIEVLSQRFARLTAQLQSRQQAVSTYTAHATHELKSPLTAVQGAAELLADAGMEATQRQKFVANISADAARMERLLQRMRSYAEAKQPPLSGTCTLKSVLPKLKPEFSGLEITALQAAQPLEIHADTLTIILKHLLENAAAHGAKSVSLVAGQNEIVVSDDGTGISAGNRDKVLTPFFTTRRSTGGTGMGLSIVKSLLEAIGGDIEVQVQPRGARFKISLRGAAT